MMANKSPFEDIYNQFGTRMQGLPVPTNPGQIIARDAQYKKNIVDLAEAFVNKANSLARSTPEKEEEINKEASSMLIRFKEQFPS